MTETNTNALPPTGKKSRYIVLDEDTVNALIDSRMSGSQYRAYLYFALMDPFGNRPVDASADMARRRLGISRSTCYEAIGRLEAEEFFSFEGVTMRVRNCFGSRSPDKAAKSSRRKIEPPSEISNKRTENRNPVPLFEPDAEKSESQALEPSQRIESGTAQYRSVEAISDHDSLKREKESQIFFQKQTIPEQEKISSIDKTAKLPAVSPPEQQPQAPEPASPNWLSFLAPGPDPNFFEFVLNRVKKFPQPPADALCAAEGWIRKQGHLLYSEYLAWAEARQRVEEAIASPPEQPPSPESPMLSVGDKGSALTTGDRLARYRGMWQTSAMRNHIQQVLQSNPEWGLEVGPDGPRAVEVPHAC